MAHSSLAQSVMQRNFQLQPLAYRLYSKKHKGGSLNDFLMDLEELQKRVDALKERIMEIAVLQIQRDGVKFKKD